jgi:parvulin-like peptidyl-prolyl isomerase
MPKRMHLLPMFILICAALILTSCTKGDRVLVTVDGKPITESMLQNRIKVMTLYYQSPLNKPEDKQRVLDQLVDEQLLLGQAAKQKLSLTDQQVGVAKDRFLFQVQQQYRETDLTPAQAMQKVGLTDADLTAFIKNFTLAEKAKEAKKAEASLTGPEIVGFYVDNMQQLYTFKTEAYHLAHILVRPDQEALAKQLLEQIKGGANWSELARTYSIDPTSADWNGDMGWLDEARMDPVIYKAVAGAKAGDLIGPVQTDWGWHIVKVVDRHGPGTLTLEQAKDDVLRRQLPKKQAVILGNWRDELRRAAKIVKITEP